nr:PDZ domain-containing protein [Oxalobacteraceae bacterium]
PRAQGALVARVEPDSPAEKAGVEAGDIIIAFNGSTIEKSGDLPRMVGSTKPGSKANLTVLRKGNKRDLPVVIAEMEADQTAKKKTEEKRKPEQTANALGLIVSDLVIVRLNNTDIRDAKQFNALVAKLDPKKNALLLVRRGDSSQFVPVKPAAQ